jgi:hypothetical protein
MATQKPDKHSAPSRRSVLIAAASAVVAGGVALTVGAATLSDKKQISLQSAIDAAKPGDIVEISQGWLIGAPVNIKKALSIRCVRGGSVRTTKDVHAFDVTAANVHFDRVNIRGIGSEIGKPAGAQAAIRAVGSARAPIRGLKIERCTITGFAKNGVEAYHVHSPVIESNTIEDVAYGGIMIFSGRDGRIAHNTIRNVVQSTFENAYGIALSRQHNKSLTDAPHTTGTLVLGNIIDGVPGWEGIDTHAGKDIRILNNTVVNCMVGIAVVPGWTPGGLMKYASTKIRVIGNTVDSKVKDGSRRPGILVVGARSGADKVVEYASAVVAENTVIGHGLQDSNIQGGIHLAVTQSTEVRNNKLIECSPSGIHAYIHNHHLEIKDNVFTDTWSNDLRFTACVYVSNHNQSVTVAGNSATRAGKKAKRVNDRGLFIGTSAKRPSAVVTTSRNNFAACARPRVDASKSQKFK